MTLKEKVIEDLMEMKIIWPGFLGQVILHIGEGPSLSDIERHEKGLVRKMKEKNSIDIDSKIV